MKWFYSIRWTKTVYVCIIRIWIVYYWVPNWAPEINSKSLNTQRRSIYSNAKEYINDYFKKMEKESMKKYYFWNLSGGIEIWNTYTEYQLYGEWKIFNTIFYEKLLPLKWNEIYQQRGEIYNQIIFIKHNCCWNHICYKNHLNIFRKFFYGDIFAFLFDTYASRPLFRGGRAPNNWYMLNSNASEFFSIPEFFSKLVS